MRIAQFNGCSADWRSPSMKIYIPLSFTLFSGILIVDVRLHVDGVLMRWYFSHSAVLLLQRTDSRTASLAPSVCVQYVYTDGVLCASGTVSDCLTHSSCCSFSMYVWCYALRANEIALVLLKKLWENRNKIIFQAFEEIGNKNSENYILTFSIYNEFPGVSVERISIRYYMKFFWGRSAYIYISIYIDVIS